LTGALLSIRLQCSLRHLGRAVFSVLEEPVTILDN
jgi:hypothetical protein